MNIIKCPGCQRLRPKRTDGQRAVCRSCSKAQRRVFQFCWACQREWPRDAAPSDTCMLPNCALRSVLLSVKQISDTYSSVRGCPYFRACPGCKALLTHRGDGCPNIICPHCHKEFCFRCLRSQCYGHDFYDLDFVDFGIDLHPNCLICKIKDNSEILQQLGL